MIIRVRMTTTYDLQAGDVFKMDSDYESNAYYCCAKSDSGALLFYDINDPEVIVECNEHRSCWYCGTALDYPDLDFPEMETIDERNALLNENFDLDGNCPKTSPFHRIGI